MITLEKLHELGLAALTAPVYPDPRFPPSVYYRFLHLLVREKKPRLSVELGVSGGGGSLHLALGWPAGRVIGVDIILDHEERIQHIFQVCDNFEFWKGDSVAMAKPIFQEAGLIDVLFIDTDHAMGQGLKEFEAYKPFLADGAVVCFDDLLHVGMEGAWDAVPEPKIRMDWLHEGTYPTGGGFGVAIIGDEEYELGN